MSDEHRQRQVDWLLWFCRHIKYGDLPIPWPLSDALLYSLMLVTMLVVAYRMPLWLAITVDALMWLLSIAFMVALALLVVWIVGGVK